MPGTTTMQEATEAQASFAPNELAALRERREAVKEEWVKAARAEMTAAEGKAGLVAEISGEAQETINRLSAEWDTITDLIKKEEAAKASADLVKADEELSAQAPNYRDRQARLMAQWYDDFMAVGRGEYTNPSPNAAAGETPGTLSMGQPLIARNPRTGKNEVYPVSPVFAGEGKNRRANVEASMRQMAIISEDKFGKYDPVTGNRVGHTAPVGRELVEADLGKDRNSPGVQEQVSDTYLIVGGQLYLYEIQMNELAQYFNIIQTPNINQITVNRRTAVGDAYLMDEASSINTRDSSFDTVTIDPFKVGQIRGASYESLNMLAEPFSVAETIVRDAGISQGNFIGRLLVTGDGSTGSRLAQQPQGLRTWALIAGNNNNFDLGSAANFLTDDTPTFGVEEMSKFMGSLPKEYFKMPGKMLVMPLRVWTALVGRQDGDNRQLWSVGAQDGPWKNNMDFSLPQYNVRVVLDENFDAGTATGQIPMFYGDLTCWTLAYYGAPRIDFSTEYGYQSDRYYWRFITYRGFQNIDPNGAKGGRISS